MTFLLGVWAGVAASMLCLEWGAARSMRADYVFLWVALCLVWPVSLTASLLGARFTAEYRDAE